MKNAKKIKCVILDLDGTLYSDGDWSNADEINLKFIKDNGYFSGSYEDFCSQDIFDKDWHFTQMIYYYLKKNNVPISVFRDYLNKNFYNFMTEKTRTINAVLVFKLSKYCKVYVLSDSSYNYVCHYLDLFKIKREWLSGVVVNDYESDDMTKIHAMKKIQDTENLKPNEIVMIGDSYVHDIVPASKLKFGTVWVQDVRDTESAIEEIIEAKEI